MLQPQQKQRPLSIQLWLGRYYCEFCPECQARACVTQLVDYDECSVPRCTNTEKEEEFHCRQIGCCHGCACDRDDCTFDCECDCHHCEVVLPELLPNKKLHTSRQQHAWWKYTHPLPLTTTIQSAGKKKRDRRRSASSGSVCFCHACLNGMDCPVTILSSGLRVTRRPKECLHFAALGKDVFSIHYANEDGRNRRLDQYFVTEKPKKENNKKHEQMIVINDDEEDDNCKVPINF